MPATLRGVRTPKCIACGRELESVFPDDSPASINQPAHGLAFSTHGHYGSTVFDPGDGSRLEINVCDPCVKDAIEVGVAIEWPVQRTDQCRHSATPNREDSGT